jgi:hypothetical protein
MRPTNLAGILSAATGLALCTLVTATGPARAADDEAWDNKLFRSILEGVGLQRGGNDINYTERAPLVIPPSASLPAPEKSAAAVESNPAWPKDPDVTRRKAEEKAARERRMVGAGAQAEEDQRVLRPDELNPPGSRRTATKDGYVNPGWGYGNQHDLDNDRSTGLLSNFFGGKREDSASFTGEPPRYSLTDPPAGYQTPSPNQPYGLAKSTTRAKPTDLTTLPEVK